MFLVTSAHLGHAFALVPSAPEPPAGAGTRRGGGALGRARASAVGVESNLGEPRRRTVTRPQTMVVEPDG